MPTLEELIETNNCLLCKLLKSQDEKQKYNISFYVAQTAGSISSGFAEVTFINLSPVTGGTNVVINNTFQLAPQASISINGNQDEIDVTPYQIKFSGSGIQNCTVIRKYYV